MMQTLGILIGYTLACTFVVHLVFLGFREPHRLVDVFLASVGSALAMIVPKAGGGLSLLVLMGILYWRCAASTGALMAAGTFSGLALWAALSFSVWKAAA